MTMVPTFICHLVVIWVIDSINLRIQLVGVGVAGEEGEEAARVGGVGGDAETDELRVVLPQHGDGGQRDGGRGRSGHGHGHEQSTLGHLERSAAISSVASERIKARPNSR